ncbi:hypothetical protein E8E15_007764 [Penicillium rubens]|nr:hypothetical protein E8E15_007764 [Penicillium rubens]
MAVDNHSVAVSETLKANISQVWENEMRKITEPLPRPKNSTPARFFPTDACNELIRTSFTEFFRKKSMLNAKMQSSASLGLVVFPGDMQIPANFSLIIPLNITGKIELDGVAMDMDHHYYRQKDEKDQKSIFKVYENSKLVMLYVTNLTIFM